MSGGDRSTPVVRAAPPKLSPLQDDGLTPAMVLGSCSLRRGGLVPVGGEAYREAHAVATASHHSRGIPRNSRGWRNPADKARPRKTADSVLYRRSADQAFLIAMNFFRLWELEHRCCFLNGRGGAGSERIEGWITSGRFYLGEFFLGWLRWMVREVWGDDRSWWFVYVMIFDYIVNTISIEI